MPVFLKRETTDQFPSLKKDNLKHSDYAKKTIQDLFPANILSEASVRVFNYPSSIVAINNGNGTFAVKRLPTRAQLSSINVICPADINSDGKPDLVTGGNLFSFPPQFGRLDASYGDVLINNGKGDFAPVQNALSGINIRGEVKDIKQMSVKGEKRFLFTQNNGYPVQYRANKQK
jgi:hypothetical protein